MCACAKRRRYAGEAMQVDGRCVTGMCDRHLALDGIVNEVDGAVIQVVWVVCYTGGAHVCEGRKGE